jgi:hypothetical protein
MSDTTKLAVTLVVGLAAWALAAGALVVGITTVDDPTARKILVAALVLWCLLLAAFIRPEARS